MDYQITQFLRVLLNLTQGRFFLASRLSIQITTAQLLPYRKQSQYITPHATKNTSCQTFALYTFVNVSLPSSLPTSNAGAVYYA